MVTWYSACATPKIAVVRYVQPKCRLVILQVSLKLQHRSTWNFRTILGQRKCVWRCSIVTSQQIQYGGRLPFWRSLNHHISVKNHPILIKFGTLQQILIKIFKIQDGGGRHLENRFFGHNSSTDYPISAKFCMRKQNGMSPLCQWKIVRFWWNLVHIANAVVTWPKIENYKNSRLRRPPLENRFFGHNSSTDFLISAKFCTRKQNGMPTKAMWQKLLIFKIQNGGRPPFWKSLNHHISVKILSDFDKIWCTTAADVEPDEILKSTITVS